MIALGVNIDHVATLRQARRGAEPDPVWAAAEAELGGADGITVHLREDRRHINDRDVRLLRQTVQCVLNLEMSLNPSIVALAVEIAPAQVCVVPERRQEITTEGGIDLLGDSPSAEPAVKRLKSVGSLCSAFIDPDPAQVAAAANQGFDAVELHTGAYANAANESEKRRQLDQLIAAGRIARERGLRLHAGHGLNYRNVWPIGAIEGMVELNIGHAIVSRAIFVGLRSAVREMKDILLQCASAQGRTHV
ncbi:MAG TPA: pyridoxine 5'-phosphate synthase [Candidatus Acidoferrales bacterium]|jgi:pyridoxine 5-phosphate synthase|nr:pyridoxine 5'-phosphate synthase [Candidatus Acidoferrales bacterium]